MSVENGYIGYIVLYIRCVFKRGKEKKAKIRRKESWMEAERVQCKQREMGETA